MKVGECQEATHQSLQRLKLPVCLDEERFLIFPSPQRDDGTVLLPRLQACLRDVVLAVQDNLNLVSNAWSSVRLKCEGKACLPLVLPDLVTLYLETGGCFSALEQYANGTDGTDSRMARSCAVTFGMDGLLPITERCDAFQPRVIKL